jgi:hypothetical protein
VYENRLSGRAIVRYKRDTVTGERRKYDEELYDMCFAPSIIRVIKSRQMRWVRHCSVLGGEEKFIHIVGREM